MLRNIWTGAAWLTTDPIMKYMLYNYNIYIYTKDRLQLNWRQTM